MTILHLDYETKSRTNLKEVGASRYARHPSTKIILTGWAFDKDDVVVTRNAEGEETPREVRRALKSRDVLKYAWNAPFEKEITEHVAGIDIQHDAWRCMMVRALTLSFPGSLDKAGKIIGLPEDEQKHARGKALVRKFTQPRKPTKNKPYEWCTHETDPEEWEEFVAYCGGDVTTERAFEQRTRQWDLPPHEWRLWFMDQKINQRGIPINMRVVRNAILVAAEIMDARLAELRDITGLANPNSGQQFLPWLRKRGYPFEDLKKGHVTRAREEAESYKPSVRKLLYPEDYVRALVLRAEVSKTSVRKYNALAAATDDDGVLRNAFQFAAAGRTWRWGGRRYQPQNLAKPAPWLEKQADQAAAVYDLERLDAKSLELVYGGGRVMDLLSTCVRPVVQAPKGYTFVDADLNAIENRVLGWLADDQKILDVFLQNRDPYIDFATHMFGGTYADRWSEYEAGNKKPRTTSKPAVLGCGYMLSAGQTHENPTTGEIEATGLLGYAWNMHVKLTQAEATLAVKVWRETFKDAVQFWWDIDKAARRCIITGREQSIRHIGFDRSGPFLRMILPSGRCLYYCRPRMRSETLFFCDEQKKFLPLLRCKRPNRDMKKKKQQITYEGLNDKGHWGRISTHPGKLTENADQAVARDLLAHGLRLAMRERIDLRLHVHDQGVGLVLKEDAVEQLKVLTDCMSDSPKWAPGLPLAAAGTISPIFTKD